MSAGLGRTGIRQRSALAMARMASALFVAAVPDPLSFKADERAFYFGGIRDPNDPRIGMAAPLFPF